MIIFEKIKFKNFLSAGNAWTEISLNSTNTTLIIGTNGAGKSTILDALTFALYGKPYRNINKPMVINSTNGKDCVVELEFSILGKSYKIVRGLKPNIFEIHINGRLLDQNSKTLDYQEYLTTSILKMGMKSLTQIVILGSASFVPFMQLSPAERREVIEDLLDIQIFSTMNVLAKQKLQLNKEEFNQVSLKIKMLDETISILKNNLTKYQQNTENKLNSLKEDEKAKEELLEVYEESIQVYRAKLEELQEKTQAIPKLREKHKKLISLQAQLKVKHEDHNKHIAFYTDNDTCPVCNQELQQNFKIESVASLTHKVSELNEALMSLDSKIDDVLTENSTLEKLLTDQNQISSEILQLQTKLESENKNLQYILKQIEELDEAQELVEENKKNLRQKEKEKLDSEKEKTYNLEDRQYLEASIQLLKDSGIKAKIIKQYLPFINKYINKYLAQMGFFVDFHIDETFKETIKSRFRDEFTYESFSEGEKMRIDLSILFAWRQIARMRNSVNTNLLILDEIFDSSLDGNGVEEFLKIMKETGDTTNTFVISHKTDALLDKFDRTIRFEKHKGYSRIAKELNEDD